MCEHTLLNTIIAYAYIGVCIFTPFYYLVMFKRYKTRRKKNYGKAILYAFMMLLILSSVKLIAYLSNIEKFNCALNGIHYKDVVTNTSSTTTSTTTTTTTTTEATTTTTTTTNPANGKIAFDVLNPPKEIRKYVGKTSKGYDIYTINGAYYINDLLIVNKTYSWPRNIEPANTSTSTKGVTRVCNNCINNTVMTAWKEMKADAAAVGFNLWIQSGYRPYEAQNNIYNNYVKRDGKAEADTYSARPSNTEHSTTICFDINNPSRTFNNTAEAKWITENCWKYGFIIRYPKDKQNETGYIYESWHVRYVGKELAQELYNDGDWITLESYLGITSQYSD